MLIFLLHIGFSHMPTVVCNIRQYLISCMNCPLGSEVEGSWETNAESCLDFAFFKLPVPFYILLDVSSELSQGVRAQVLEQTGVAHVP